MQRPPLPFELPVSPVPPEPESDEPQLPRLKWIWIAFIAFFVLLIGRSLSVADQQSIRDSSSDKVQERLIEVQLDIKSLLIDQSQNGVFTADIDALLEKARTDHKTQKLRVVLRQEDNDKPFGADIENLAKSKDPEDQIFAKLYSDHPPEKQEALRLVDKLDGNELSERLAKVQIKEKYGDKAIRAQTFNPNAAIGIVLIMVAGSIGFFLGIGAWIYYYAQRSQGRLKPKGLPMANIDWGRAERLLFVALIVITTYFVSGLVAVQFLGKRIDDFEIVVFLPIFVVIAICLKVPIFGWRILPEKVGLSFKNFGSNVIWALSAFIANIPILVFLMIIAGVLMRFLPGGEHPVAEEILNNPKPAALVNIFVLACVIAPIWEEFFFRGLVFPAFTKALGKPLYGALVSSFIFASIHPQGAVGIVPLLGVAMMLCAVSVQTKSLVANMMLHSLHNGATLLVALIFAPMLR